MVDGTYVRVYRPVREVETVSRNHDRVRVNIHSDRITSEQFRLHQGCSAPHHLVEDKVARVGVA